MDMDETMETGARRELVEETGLEVGPLAQCGTFGDPGRDPRGRTISVGFVGVLLGEPPAPQSGDDASDAKWHPVRRLPKLAFDHRTVIRTTRDWLAAARTILPA